MRRYLLTYLRVLLASLILPMSAHAVTYSDKTIKKVHINNGIFFQIDGEMVDLEGCGSNTHYRIAKDNPYEKELFSLLLTAKTSGSKVQFAIDGCENSYPKLTWINAYN